MALKDHKQIIEALKTAKTALKTLEAQNIQSKIDFIDQQIAKRRKDLVVLEFARRDGVEKLKVEILHQKTDVHISMQLD